MTLDTDEINDTLASLVADEPVIYLAEPTVGGVQMNAAVVAMRAADMDVDVIALTDAVIQTNAALADEHAASLRARLPAHRVINAAMLPGMTLDQGSCIEVATAVMTRFNPVVVIYPGWAWSVLVREQVIVAMELGCSILDGTRLMPLPHHQVQRMLMETDPTTV